VEAAHSLTEKTLRFFIDLWRERPATEQIGK
jgi:hypothetical protein